MDVRLTIVVPARNEAERLGTMLDAYLPYFCERYGREALEILVVVNGSTDTTEGVARGYARTWPCVRVVVEPGRVGKGGALMIGFREARGALVGFVDADGSTPPAAFEDLVRAIDGAGIVIANRWHPESRVTPQPWSRRVASRAFNYLVRLLFKVRTTDTQCGAKLMTRRAMEDVLPRLGITQWAFDIDLLFQLRRHGHKIIEIPTVWNDTAGSQLRVSRASIEMIVAIVRLRLIYSRLRWIVTLYDRTLGRLLRHRV